MNTLKKVNKGFIKVSEYIAFVLSAVICAMIVWWAAKRYLFKGEFYGAEELILAIAFWMYFIGSYVAAYEDSHISADLLTGMIKGRKGQLIAKLVRLVISLFAFALLTWLAWDFLTFDIVRNKITVMFRFPQAWIHVILPVSFALSFIYTVAHTISTIIDLRECGKVSAGGEGAQPETPAQDGEEAR